MQGIMTITEAAEALNVQPIAVLRLIARGQLPATTLGRGVQRITDAGLSAYVTKGAPDLNPPAKFDGDGWFADSAEANTAADYRNAFIAAGEDAIDAGALAKLAEQQPPPAHGQRVGAFSLAFPFATEGVKAILRSPDAATFAVHEIRKSAARILDGTFSRFSRAEKLYASPEALRETIKLAVASARQKPVGFERSFPRGIDIQTRASISTNVGTIADAASLKLDRLAWEAF